MIATRTHGGGRIGADDRADACGDEIHSICRQIHDLGREGAREDFDLATLITQVPAPITALNLDARRIICAKQMAIVIIELEAIALGVHAAALAYRQAEKGISDTFGGLLDALGYAAGRMIALGLPVIIPVALTVAAPIAVGVKDLDITGLDDIVARRLGIDLSQTKEQVKEAFVALVFENSDVSGAVIEHVLPGFVVGFIGLPPRVLATESGTTAWPHDSRS